MHILVLSKNNFLYSTQSLMRAAVSRGHKVEVIDYTRINSIIGKDGVNLFYQGEALDNIDAVIGRISPVYSPLGASILSQFAAKGSLVFPTADALLLARNKWRAQTELQAQGIPMPSSAMLSDLEQLPQLVEQLGGYPIIAKLLESTHGSGVIKCPDSHSLRSLLDAFAALNKGVLLQEYIVESKGIDIRVIVCGGKVVAAMKRSPAAGEFRSNLHRGGQATGIKLKDEEAEIALRAAKAVGLRVAGVDILRSNRGPLVMEVNASPGLEGIEAASGVDVAGAIIAEIEFEAEAKA